MLSKENGIIYRNTIIIYIRMIFVTFVGLVSARFVLQALGASDYGLYNVVGGLIALLNFISTAMATTTRRFINVEMGKQDGNLNKVFNISLLLHICFAFFILIIAETVGIWYIYNVLNVEAGKLNDAMFVFQISTIVACIGIINVPYQSLIEANEQFGKAAIIDMLTVTIKLILVVLLLYYSGNALRFYAICMCAVTVASFLLYHGICYRQWPDTIRFKYYKKSPLYKEILIFNNYTALGAAFSIGKIQGSNLLVNFFFGTVVNAAFAIAYQIESSVYMFVNKLTLAANPQVAQNYSGPNKERSTFLVEKNTKYSILIMTVLFFVLTVDMEFILSVWLKSFPAETPLFCTLTMIWGLVISFSEGTYGYIQASGKIKWFQIITSTLAILNLPLAYILFKIGFDSYWILVLFILTTIFNRVVTLYLMKRLLSFDVKRFFFNAYASPLVVIIISLPIFICCRLIHYTAFYEHMLELFIMFVYVVTAVYMVGFTKSERATIKSLIFNKK